MYLVRLFHFPSLPAVLALLLVLLVQVTGEKSKIIFIKIFEKKSKLRDTFVMFHYEHLSKAWSKSVIWMEISHENMSTVTKLIVEKGNP